MKRFILISLVLISTQYIFSQTFKELAQTPPMGWNSWNTFSCNVSETMIKGMADAMVSSGMKEAGYQYIVIDDCWQIDRDVDGVIVADPARFPSGIKALADYIHSHGLKFGLYSCAGTNTCAGRPGSKGYEYLDAETYAQWGVDYLKYDWCNTTGQNSRTSYKLMSDALQASGRPIVFSICEWGSTQPWLWARGIGHLWRTTGDIQATWKSMTDILDSQVGLEKYAGPGGWNDPDMLEVGNGSLTAGENRAHFSLWCLLAAPLIAGNDLRNMKPEIINILTNKEVIAVNQDSLGIQGHKIKDDGNFEVWIKPMNDSSTVVLFLNRSPSKKEMSISWDEIAYSGNDILFVRDLWKKQDVGYLQNHYSAVVPSHDVVLTRIWHKAPPSEIPIVSFILPADSSRFPVTDGIELQVDASDSDGEIVKVDFTANGALIGTDADSTDGWSLLWHSKKSGLFQIIAYATDNTGITASSTPLNVYLAPEAGPFYGSPMKIPAIIEAEDYDGGGEGIGYHDSDAINQIGQYRWDGVDIGYFSGQNSCYYVGLFESGEWLRYTIDIPEQGSYDISLNTASLTNTASCSFELDGNDVTGPIHIPRSGGMDVWKTTTVADITLPAGIHDLKFSVQQKDFNLDHFEIDYALQELPEPWQHQDIGQPDAEGDVRIRKGKFIVTGSGSDIWNNSDEFHFVYQQISGDAEIIARVISLENIDPWSKAGVMMRNSLQTSSSHVMMILSAGNGTAFQRRTSNGGSSTHTAGSSVQAPYWVRLVRKGNLFTAYDSENGTLWQKIGSETIQMAQSIFIGLAVTSHNDGVLCEAQFDNIVIKQENTKVGQDRSDPPGKFTIYPVYPNPFNSEISIKYDLAVETDVTISIFDVLGKEVRVLEHEKKKAGTYHTIWNAKDNNGMVVASGVYIWKIHFNDKTELQKAIYVK
jgi:alpha-galactosidase